MSVNLLLPLPPSSPSLSSLSFSCLSLPLLLFFLSSPPSVTSNLNRQVSPTAHLQEDTEDKRM